MQITDAAKEMLLPVLAENPGKSLRVVFEVLVEAVPVWGWLWMSRTRKMQRWC